MGNQTSNDQNPQQYQRMGSAPNANRSSQPQYNRTKSSETSKQQQISVDNAIDTLQSMFVLMDREVLRLVLMEQCGGNLDNAVNTLLVMQQSQTKLQPTIAVQPKQPSAAAPKDEAILYDDNMRPIAISDNFLQPPSHFLSKYYGLNSAQIANLQIQNEVSKQMQSGAKIHIDPSIVGQWTNLLKKYRFKDKATMHRLCSMECKSLHKCGSLVRVIFMMKLFHRLCNQSGEGINARSAPLMHEYLSRGFKEYSLIQLINDCNHLTQYHQFGGEGLKSLIDEKERNKLLSEMRVYFGQCDVMHCRIIQRILARQDNNDNRDVKNEIEVERDIVDKYHRVFFHPLN